MTEVMSMQEMIENVSAPQFKYALVWDMRVFNAHQKSMSDIFTGDFCQFSLSNLNKHRSTMSAVKLSYLNRGHLQRKLERSDETLQLVQRATEAVKTAFPDAKARVLEPTYIEHVLKLTVDRIETLGDLPLVSACFFERPDYASKEAQVMRRQIKTETLGKPRYVRLDIGILIDAVFHLVR